jgi:hypothetical protein
MSFKTASKVVTHISVKSGVTAFTTGGFALIDPEIELVDPLKQ